MLFIKFNQRKITPICWLYFKQMFPQFESGRREGGIEIAAINGKQANELRRLIQVALWT